MQITFLFWNIYKRPLQERVAQIVATHSVDVVMLAECSVEPDAIITALNARGGGPYSLPFSLGEKIRIFTRFDERLMEDAFNNPLGALTVRRVRIGEPPGILLAVAHLPSRVNWSQDEQAAWSQNPARDIQRVEDDQQLRRTVLVGDLNMNPFDPGVVGALSLHGVMTKDRARKIERGVMGDSYRFFYNPMWGCFGDRTAGPPGTYHYSSANPNNHYWNMFDQVLLRPELMDKLCHLQILDSDGSSSLLTSSGIPDKMNGSDHLPLLFTLDL